MTIKNKIIVTGGAGFVGTNLIKLLLKKTNYEILFWSIQSTTDRASLFKPEFY